MNKKMLLAMGAILVGCAGNTESSDEDDQVKISMDKDGNVKPPADEEKASDGDSKTKPNCTAMRPQDLHAASCSMASW